MSSSWDSFCGDRPLALSLSTEAWDRWEGVELTRIGNAPRPDGLRLVVLGADPGGGIRTLVWPVKFIRSMGESAEWRACLGVASSSSPGDVLLRDKRCNGLRPVAGVDRAIELRVGRGVQPSSGRIGFVGELRMLANRVVSVGMAEIVLRSPTVSSCMVLSRQRVMSMSLTSPGSCCCKGLFSLSQIVLMSSFNAVLLIIETFG